jgi:glucokinase
MPAGRLVVGVDVGATKIAAGVADERGQVIASHRVRTAPAGGRHVVDQISGLLEAVVPQHAPAEGRTAAIGVAVPAVIDRSKGAVLWAPNIAGWQQELEVARPVSDTLGLPVSLHYDGHAWVVGEWWCGAARGAKDVALVAVGTGIGGGLILGGRLHMGHVGVAGALGWWTLERSSDEATSRSAGRNLEAIASGPAIAAAAGMDTAPEVFAAAREGDPEARDAVDQAAEALGSAVANLVSLIDPEIVVLGGGVIDGAADLLLPRIQHLVGDRAQPQVSHSVRVVASELGEDAAWLGAGRLALGPIDRE